MKVKLNEVQEELLKRAKEQGFLTEDDFSAAYSSPITVRSNIKRFILLGFIEKTEEKDKFKYIKQK